tara:strand:+ start:71986 stop:74307 length:2322 start_codon:yes stop_codon:yes gene_type:complete
MKKSYSTSTRLTLVIVESPAKCKKIEGFLGPGYKCVASFGHLCELPSLNHIDIQKGFHPTFVVADNKRKYVSSLKKHIAEAKDIILATDDDREGEAIAWHICRLFNLSVEKTKRIIFHEITESAVQKAVANPTTINMNVVYAQQARQILDVLVGFKISPVLWKHVARQALSAGRCQTPALKLIYENQQEIDKAVGKLAFTTTGYFQISKQIIPFTLTKEFLSEDDLLDFYENSIEFKHMFTCSSPTITSKQPPLPFNTSRLQQAASNEFHFSPKDTMKMCQTLYEGGYITYMRTDSRQFSEEFIKKTESYILSNYHHKHLGSSSQLKKLTNNNENPHEAIRPTKITLESVPDKCSAREQKLYKLIRDTTLQSCMSPAEFNSIKATITCPDKEAIYVHKSERIYFPGWMIVGKNSTKETDERIFKVLSSASPGQVNYTKIMSAETMKDLKQHYTEARLVQLLEDKGIGRPSTFSSLVEKIQERGYVKKTNVAGKKVVCKEYELDNKGDIFESETTKEYGNEKNKLVIQPTGTVVMEFLNKHFSDLFQYEYTSQMEDNLDAISTMVESSAEIKNSTMREYYEQIEELLESLKQQKVDKIEYKIDDQHVYLIGKNGPVIKCTTSDESVSFKPVRIDIDVEKLKRGEYKVDEIIDKDKIAEHNLGSHEGHDVVLKKGKFGIYAKWADTNISLKSLGNRPIENIRLEDVIAIMKATSDGTRKISDSLFIRTSAKGPYIFFKTFKMKKPKFFSLKDCPHDFMNCDLEELKQWITDVHGV